MLGDFMSVNLLPYIVWRFRSFDRFYSAQRWPKITVKESSKSSKIIHVYRFRILFVVNSDGCSWIRSRAAPGGDKGRAPPPKPVFIKKIILLTKNAYYNIVIIWTI
jgi:hypothetical protein